jgi:hypothetical protein
MANYRSVAVLALVSVRYLMGHAWLGYWTRASFILSCMIVSWILAAVYGSVKQCNSTDTCVASCWSTCSPSNVVPLGIVATVCPRYRADKARQGKATMILELSRLA